MSVNRNRSKLKNVISSKEYTMKNRDAVGLSCPICRPHKGCNRRYGSSIIKNWKKYRKYQYKS